MMRPRLAATTTALVLALAVTAFAQTPRVVRYGGVVRDAAGQPRAGAATLTFSIYTDAEGGAALWTESQAVTLDAEGRYAAMLGATTPGGLPAELFAQGEARWLGIAVDGGPEAARVALVSVPYALKAADADTVGGKPLSAFVLAGEKTGVGADGLTYMSPTAMQPAPGPTANSGTPGYIGKFTSLVDLGNSALFQLGDSIGLGTLTPAAIFHVAAPVAPAAYFDVYSSSLGVLPTVNRAARGTAAAPSAVQTNDILGGLAVRGFGTSTFGGGVGQVMYRAAENFTETARGTYLQMTTTPKSSVTWQERLRIDPDGYVGINTTTPLSRLDVVGQTWVTGGTLPVGLGVDMSAGATSDGISVQNNSETGTGIIAWADAANAVAVVGSSDYGTAIAGFTYNGYAGFFDGDVEVTGTLSKGAGSFKIDHPLDPEHKYLSHSFVESPDMKNVYDGVATLDANGEATVTLPDWFEALNRDFRYQLTPMGAPFVPYVAEEIAGNRFKIAGGMAGKKVSWQVTGIRHDAFANMNRIPVEEMKPEPEIGTYLHPAAFGQPVPARARPERRELRTKARERK